MHRGVYVRAGKGRGIGNVQMVSIGLFFFFVCILLSFFMKSINNYGREDLIEVLEKMRNVSEINDNLKIEYSATTRMRFLELQAKRLGLKKAKEEEVLVLR